MRRRLVTHSPSRPGFSLLELMIAIIIFGIGMVMVATVFPVGLDITRDAIQQDLQQSLSDAAEATLLLRLPIARNIVPPPATSNLVLLPDAYAMEVLYGPAEISQPEWEAWDAMEAGVASDPVAWDDWRLEDVVPNPTDFVPYARVYSEATAWEGEAQDDFHTTYVVRAQAPAVSGTPLVEPTVPVIGRGRPSPRLRISLGDRVYPPLPVRYSAEDLQYVDAATGDLIPYADLDERLASAAADRRYSWTAIHRMVSSPDNQRRFLVNLVVTHRGELGARYAQQRETRSGIPAGEELRFDLLHLYQPPPAALPSDVEAAVDALLRPVATTVAESGTESPRDMRDSLLPLPWLVMFNEFDLAGGEIRCTAEVARLLPVGSWFIVARHWPPGDDMVLQAGEPYKVLNQVWDPEQLGKDWDDQVLARLQISRSASASEILTDVPVWVFPPAIEEHPSALNPSSRAESGRFGRRSPVVGVMPKVIQPW